MNLNSEQKHEVYKTVDALNEARAHLDNAMFRLGRIDEADLGKLRKVYDLICEAQDEL